MALTLSEIIKLKTDRLSTIPDKLISEIEKVQKEVLPSVLEIINQLERDKSGMILLTEKNLALASNIRDQLRGVLLDSEYTKYISEFIHEFDVQSEVSNIYFKKAFEGFETSKVALQVVANQKKKATDLFINAIVDQAFAGSIADQVDNAISTNASFSETFKIIHDLVTGNDEVDGKLKKYSQQVAHDSFALSDRSYTSAATIDLGIEFYFYSGSEIATSRDFCIERHNHYYHKKEIESWGSLTWAGQIEGTNAQTIFTTAGGWNCRHSIIPVSTSRVPREVLLRNIDNGNFKPTEFERKELGLF